MSVRTGFFTEGEHVHDQHCVVSEFSGCISKDSEYPIIYARLGYQEDSSLEVWRKRAVWGREVIFDFFDVYPSASFCLLVDFSNENMKLSRGLKELKLWVPIFKHPQINRIICFDIPDAMKNDFSLYVALTGQQKKVAVAASRASAHEFLLDWMRLHGYTVE